MMVLNKKKRKCNVIGCNNEPHDRIQTVMTYRLFGGLVKGEYQLCPTHATKLIKIQQEGAPIP